MFPIRCIQPPWMNIEVTSVSAAAGPGPCAPCSASVRRSGTSPQLIMNDLRPGPSRISCTNTTTLTAMIARVTNGVVLEGLTSRSGIMVCM